ncbi:MAG: hypothetical protein Q8O54_07405 [Brevundimonas sp.]|nr:hypothetical protein [Brevundimonas sp.]
MTVSGSARPKPGKLILEPELAARLVEACDRSALVPPPNYGRLRWISEQFASRFSDQISVETVRRWLSGEGKPKGKRLRYLAQLLDVDEAWLTVGPAPHRGVKEEGPAFQETQDKADKGNRGSDILDRIQKRLGGTVKVAPGVDLTAPTGEIWDAERD